MRKEEDSGLCKRMLNWLDEFYGNRKLLFDLSISLIITLVLFIFFPLLNQSFYSIDLNIKTAIIGFLGIILGFILTAFSILFVYTPSESKILDTFRKSPPYHGALTSFISCSLILFLASVTLVILSIMQSAFLFWLIILLGILSILRFIKCLYFLISIVEINYSSD